MHRGSPAAVAASARPASCKAALGSPRTTMAAPSAASSTTRFAGASSAVVTATTASSCARRRACSWTGLRANSWIFRKTTLARVPAAFVVFICQEPTVLRSYPLPIPCAYNLRRVVRKTRELMIELKAVSLAEVSEGIRKSVKPVSILWQPPDTVVFGARGRPHRTRVHADPSDEVMYMIEGEMNLHYLTSEGTEKVALVREGEIIYCPAGVRHSPRFSPDSFLLVLERKRRSDEKDRFFWYCEKCHSELYEAVRHVA